MSGVRARAAVNASADVLRVLGGTFGGDEAKREAVREKLRSMRSTRAFVKHVDAAAVEMEIARFCLGVSKIQHLLR
eukprot:6473500-Lingulodinium_polyedra.AAC.1